MFSSTGNWILERSIDGVTFEPWQYYAITETECLTRFNITPQRGPPSYTRDDEVICTTFYSKIHPLENGEVTATEVVSGLQFWIDLGRCQSVGLARAVKEWVEGVGVVLVLGLLFRLDRVLVGRLGLTGQMQDDWGLLWPLKYG